MMAWHFVCEHENFHRRKHVRNTLVSAEDLKMLWSALIVRNAKVPFIASNLASNVGVKNESIFWFEHTVFKAAICLAVFTEKVYSKIIFAFVRFENQIQDFSTITQLTGLGIKTQEYPTIYRIDGSVTHESWPLKERAREKEGESKGEVERKKKREREGERGGERGGESEGERVSQREIDCGSLLAGVKIG